MKMRIT